jgi:hypothetical protein
MIPCESIQGLKTVVRISSIVAALMQRFGGIVMQVCIGRRSDELG